MKKKHETMPDRSNVKVLRLHKETLRMLEERTDLAHAVGGSGTRVSYCDSPTGHGCCLQN
jgi:hypothetical protein